MRLKAIIVDFDGKYAVVATPRGDFKRIYNRFDGASIGDEIDISGMSAPFGMTKEALTMVAACLLIFILGGYSYLSIQPVTFITLDINPSIELSLNKFGRVIEVKGLSSDGIDMIGDGRAFHKMDMEKAIRVLLDQAVSMNYLNRDTNTVMIAVSHVNNNVSPNLNDKLKVIAESELETLLSSQSSKLDVSSIATDEIKDKTKYIVMVENIAVERRKEAADTELSQGKLFLYDKLKEVKPDVTIEHIKEATVTQIVNELKELEASLKDNKDSKDIKKQIRSTHKAIESELKSVVKELSREENQEKKLGDIEEKISRDIQKHLRKELREKKKDYENKDTRKDKKIKDLNIKVHNHKETLKEDIRKDLKDAIKDKTNKNSIKNNVETKDRRERKGYVPKGKTKK